MSDLELIQIFEKIWEADLYSQREPFYSMAIAIAESWHQNIGTKEILLKRLRARWKDQLLLSLHYIPLMHTKADRIKILRKEHKDSSYFQGIIYEIEQAKLSE